MGSAVEFLPIPPNPEVTYNINLLWSLDQAPAGTIAVWTYGKGISTRRIGSAKDLETYFAVEPLYQYTTPPSCSIMKRTGLRHLPSTPRR